MAPTPDIATLSPRAREIVAVARERLEDEGREGISTRRLARHLGIRAPSLYSHFANKQELEDTLVTDGLWELGDRLAAEIAIGDDPVVDAAGAFRAFAVAHPHLFRLMFTDPGERTGIDPAAERRVRELIRRATGQDVVGARVLWSFAFGLAELEVAGRFADDGPAVDELWDAGLAALKAAMPMSAATR